MIIVKEEDLLSKGLELYVRRKKQMIEKNLEEIQEHISKKKKEQKEIIPNYSPKISGTTELQLKYLQLVKTIANFLLLS